MQHGDVLAALEARLAAAFDRIGRGLDRLPGGAPPGDHAEALEVERQANAQLAERLRSVKEQAAAQRAEAAARVAELTRQLDAQGIELSRMKKTVLQLRETLRAQTDAMAEGLAEPHLVNRAMLSELETLRALRLTEMAEMDAVLGELASLVVPPAAAPFEDPAAADAEPGEADARA
jgi:hypothetical protein